jgi:hypothetical protein
MRIHFHEGDAVSIWRKLEKYDSGKCRKPDNGGQDERCGSESSCGGAESRKLRHFYNANYNKNRH